MSALFAVRRWRPGSHRLTTQFLADQLGHGASLNAYAPRSCLVGTFCISPVSEAGWNDSKTARPVDVQLLCPAIMVPLMVETVVLDPSKMFLGETNQSDPMVARSMGFPEPAFISLGLSVSDSVLAEEISFAISINRFMGMHHSKRQI